MSEVVIGFPVVEFSITCDETVLCPTEPCRYGPSATNSPTATIPPSIANPFMKLRREISVLLSGGFAGAAGLETDVPTGLADVETAGLAAVVPTDVDDFGALTGVPTVGLGVPTGVPIVGLGVPVGVPTVGLEVAVAEVADTGRCPTGVPI
jgi:hypothetical protein